jgi:glucosamine--fructose-6-phosphate aminotransferase (isomerizing)
VWSVERDESRQPGSRFLHEIREQPGVLEQLAAQVWPDIQAVARAAAGARSVRLVAHGSSDNAASYGVYAFPLLANIAAFRESISLLTYYGSAPDLHDSVVVAVSQSGRTPDVVDYVLAARGRAALTVALTNDLASPLADAAEAVIPLGAGREEAIAATKTYTASIAALALLAGALGGRGEETAEGVTRCAALLAEAVPSLQEEVGGAAARLRATRQMMVIGRGIEFATAREIALKLLETCRVAAEPLTATDLAHGPVAALDALFPVWAIASDDEALPAVLEATARAHEAGATIIASGSAADAVVGASYVLPVPAPRSPLLTPLLSVVPGQLFAWALARTKGLDPDEPRGLSKVTLAS